METLSKLRCASREMMCTQPRGQLCPCWVPPGARAVFVGREIQIGVPGAAQGEGESIELSHPVHSSSTDQKSPDIRRMGSTRASLISQTLSEPAAGPGEV